MIKNKLTLEKKKINFEKIYFYSIWIFAFTMPLSRALISFFIFFLPLLWVFEGEFKRKIEQISNNKILVVLSIYIAYNFFAYFWSENIVMAFNSLRLTSYLFVIFVIATSLKKIYIEKIIGAFLLGMFISEIIAYGVFFELWTFKYATPETPSPFMMHIDYSVYMALSSILLLNRLFSDNYPIKEKIIYAFFFMTVTGNLFLSTGRTGQIAFLVAIIVMTLIKFRFSFKSLFISLFLIITILTTAHAVSKSFQDRVNVALYDIEEMKKLNFSSSLGFRIAFWVITYDIVKKEPFGVGVGDYMDATKKQIEIHPYDYLHGRVVEFVKNHHPHSQYLLALLQMGVIGLFLLIYLIYTIITEGYPSDLAILFTTVFFISCLTEPLLIKQFTIALFILFVGLLSVDRVKN